MSLDNLNECGSCGEHAAVAGWIQMYRSHGEAQTQGAPDFLSALCPGPMILKVEGCFMCGQMKMVNHAQYTEEDIKAVETYYERQKGVAKTGSEFNDLFGKLFKPKSE